MTKRETRREEEREWGMDGGDIGYKVTLKEDSR